MCGSIIDIQFAAAEIRRGKKKKKKKKQTTGHYFCYSFVNSLYICKILSLVQRAANFQQNQ